MSDCGACHGCGGHGQPVRGGLHGMSRDQRRQPRPGQAGALARQNRAQFFQGPLQTLLGRVLGHAQGSAHFAQVALGIEPQGHGLSIALA